MAVLVWDQVGDRRYETGIDRGVLYLPDGTAVTWNGLTSITENRSREVKSYFMDGIKYLDHQTPSGYAAKVQAFTYPDQLESLIGNVDFVPGVVVHDQRASLFHFSYRTRIANDVDGEDYAYRIHIIYNVMASPSDASFNTLNESVSAAPFEWQLTATPDLVSGMRPTSHISLDSRTLNPALLETLEGFLYGSSTENPSLPGLVTLLGLIEGP